MSGPLIVIPCLNEEAHLRSVLDALCADPAARDASIIVADGGSQDASREIVAECARVDPRVLLLHNPKRLQAAGVNLAARAFGEGREFLVRVDAHAAYPADFLTRLMEAQRETGADSVTVSMRARALAHSCFQIATATAQNSRLGAGGSPHRMSGARRWVDHGHHALFKLSAFLAAGGYDETYTHNEDAEFDCRLLAQGGRILLAADIVIDYFPRRDALGLARQYFRYGVGRARTARQHQQQLKPRQWAPACVAPALALAAFAPFWAIAAVPAMLWLGACLGYGLVLGAKEKSICAAFAGGAAAIMHAAWSFGFLAETFSLRRSPPNAD